MKKLLFAVLALFSLAASANPIDDQCPQLTYRHAPEVQADQYLCRTEYAVAYSYATKNPIYTTEYLTQDHTGSLPRTNDFKTDPDLPRQYAATPKDYLNAECNGGRCDRGHMTPDQDFSACEVCVHESFLMSNMVPQNFKNNEVIWKAMETWIRKYVAQGHAVYVITGPIYTADPPRIGNGVAVPDHLFKVMIDAESGKSIAWAMGNVPIPTKELSAQVTSLARIEQLTGISFDAALDKETVSRMTDW